MVWCSTEGKREQRQGNSAWGGGEAGRMKRAQLLLSQMRQRKQLQCVKKPVVVWSGVEWLA